MAETYLPETLTREQVDALPGRTVLQFGTNWCGYCRGAEPAIEQGLAQADGLRRILVEDGPGRPLGRSYRVKLWPTLIFLADGVEVARLVRPWNADAVGQAAATLTQATGSGHAEQS